MIVDNPEGRMIIKEVEIIQVPPPIGHRSPFQPRSRLNRLSWRYKQKSIKRRVFNFISQMISIRDCMIAKEIQRIFKENRKSDKKIINMIKQLAGEKGVSIETDQKWIRHTMLKIPMVTDVNKQLTRDKNTYQYLFKKFNQKDSKIDSNQDLLEQILKIKEECNNDLVVILQSTIKGKIIIHRDKRMDMQPIMIEDEGLTHHILCEINEFEVVPHKLMMMRKEIYQIFGDQYGLMDSQRDQIQVISINEIEGRMIKREQQINMQVEDIDSKEIWRVLQENQDRQQALLQDQGLNQSEVQIIETPVTKQTPNIPKIKLKESMLREIKQSEHCDNPNDISVQEMYLSPDNLQYILNVDISSDQDKHVQSFKATMPGKARRVAHLEYYLSQKYKWRYGTIKTRGAQAIKEVLSRIDFIPDKVKVGKIELDLQTMFIWSYAGRWVNFTNYMMSIDKTQAWHYITNHYKAMRKARMIANKLEAQMNEDEKFFKVANWDKFQELYDEFIENALYKMTNTQDKIVGLISYYRLEEAIQFIKDRELLVENDAFYDNSNFTKIYTRKKNKQRQIKVLYRKVTYMKGEVGKFFIVQGDVHSKINILMECAILMPGDTPKNTYKWGFFNINRIKKALSSSMESMLSSNSYTQIHHHSQYLKNWIQSYKDLSGKRL